MRFSLFSRARAHSRVLAPPVCVVRLWFWVCLMRGRGLQREPLMTLLCSLLPFNPALNSSWLFFTWNTSHPRGPTPRYKHLLQLWTEEVIKGGGVLVPVWPSTFCATFSC